MENRLVQIRKQLALKQSDLARILDCSPENISMIERGKSSLSERNRKCLVKKFNLNPLWFEDVSEPMFQASAQHAQSMSERSRLVPASVPLYDVEKIESLAGLFDRGRAAGKGVREGAKSKPGRLTKTEKMYAPTGYISIPGLPACDGALRVSGDAMAPFVNGGDVVIYSQLAHSTGNFSGEIFWGETYLLEVETTAGNYIAVRRLRRSLGKDMATLAAANPEYADTEIPLSKIRALALIKATIHLNMSK